MFKCWKRALLAIAALMHAVGVQAEPADPAAVRYATCAVHKQQVNGVTIAYRVLGSSEDEAVVLIPGIGMQLIEWPSALIEGLIENTLRVILLDMRDSGESTHFESAGQPDWPAIFSALQAGEEAPLPYSASDMSNDVLGLMDALGIEEAHFLGISGGATIAEVIAMAHPDRVKSLTLIAANSGNPAVTLPANPAAFAGQPQPKQNETHEEAVARRAGMDAILAGGDSSLDNHELRSKADRAVRRDNDPFGSLRQGAALLVLGDLRTRLSNVPAPTTVIHGQDDPLIPVQLGREVAEAIPNAQFHELSSMGHNLPSEHIPFIIEAVVQHSGPDR